MKLRLVRNEPHVHGWRLSASNHWHTVTPDDCVLGQLFNELRFSPEDLQTDTELKTFPSSGSCGSIFTATSLWTFMCLYKPACSLRKSNRSEMDGNTCSTTMTLNILLFFSNQVPFQFLFSFLLLLSLMPASYYFFYHFLFCCYCVFVAFSSPCVICLMFFTWRHCFFP